ncbi:active breakpoint cluster region-related protein-like isoform X1 [Mytilus edulis]|uniref:active breakpoint cluster region-related protein-like isoform X1 n=1 Tax=Mytilus edulis TaxID=6550 RepID=UPI0039F144A6
MEEIQRIFDIEWKEKFPSVNAPLLQSDLSSDNYSCKRPREILQKLYNATRTKSDKLKSQLEQCEFMETFLQGKLAADNDSGERHYNNNRGSKHLTNGIGDALEKCIKSAVTLNAGIVLESNIDEDNYSNKKDNQVIEHPEGSSNGHVVVENELASPPELLTTQICDKTNFDSHESVDDNDQDLKQKCHRNWNSEQVNQVTPKSDPLPRKFLQPKIHPKPAVPPRKDILHESDNGIDIITPIQCVNGPIFKSTIKIVGENSTFSTFKGKSKVKETNLDNDLNNDRDNEINNHREEDTTGLSSGNKQIKIKPDYSDSEADNENMRKIRKKSNRDSEEKVVATSFKKISHESESTNLVVDKQGKNVKHHVQSDQSNHLQNVKTLSDKPPGLPERKPSMEISQIENLPNLQKRRQSRNDYENISLDFILTRSQTITDDSPDSEENEEDLYDNVTEFRKSDNTVDHADKAANNLETLSTSSGGDNSSASHSPSAIHDHVPSIRDSVFISDDVKYDRQSKLLEDNDLEADGNSDPESGHVTTEIRIAKTTDDDDSTEDSISCDSLDDRKIDEIERMRQDRQKKLHMRQIVVKGILESEKTYLQILQEITTIKRNLQTKSLQEHCRMCPLEDLSTIFYKVEEIKQYHQTFVQSLQEKVNNWSDEQKIGEIFKELTFYIPIYKEYVDNINKARDLVQKYCTENGEFKRMVSTMEINMTNGFIEKTNLEEALFKPVQRLQRNTLVLHDLLMHTPHDHPDYQMLNKALSLADLNIKSFGEEEDGGSSSSTGKPKEQGHLVKSGFVIEVIGNSRKLRFLFLYSDIIVCTKHKVSGRHKVKSFDCKWFIPISNINVETKSTDGKTYSCKEDIDAMKKRIVSLKSELRKEIRKKTESFRDRTWSLAGKVSSRNIEKLKKKIEEQEAQLVLSSPYLPLHIQTRDEDSKDYIILISTDFEREEWRDAILSQQRHPHGIALTRELSVHGIQTMVNKSTQLPQVNNIGNYLSKNDEEMLSGLLNVTIHCLYGLDQPSDVFAVLELDSYGHFFKKAQTHKCLNTTDPTWDEDFELELDGSQTLRVLCYKVASPNNVLIGRSALELSKEWLSSSFKEQKISMNEISLTVSVRHTTTAKTLKRTPSKLHGGIFGFKIKTVTMREGKTIPTFVASCIRLVEQKGMDEVGIYRISGVTSEIQRIKRAFDKNLRAGLNILSDSDIHAVTGVLKLYFRELPEPLFTEESYPQFVDSIALADEDSKEKCMLQLLHNLPDVNYYCIVSVIEHLVKVSKHESENKMSLNNLATIFGPTLLHPAVKDDSKVSPAMMMMQGAQDVFTQAAVLYYFLNLVHSGKSIRKSSQLI